MQLNINIIRHEIPPGLLYNHLCCCIIVTFPIHKWAYEIRGQCCLSLKVVLLVKGSFVLFKQRICYVCKGCVGIVVRVGSILRDTLLGACILCKGVGMQPLVGKGLAVGGQ
jgi:hypothetical protein